MRWCATTVALCALLAGCVSAARDQARDQARPAYDGADAGTQPVRITGHTDGDTLRAVPVGDGVLEAGTELKVRLLEIDAPESVDPRSPEECFARASARELARMLPVGATAWALPDRDLVDPYGRTLLYLWNEDGGFVNRAMVRRGYARAVLYPPNDRFIDEMRSAESLARRSRRGLWGSCAFEPLT